MVYALDLIHLITMDRDTIVAEHNTGLYGTHYGGLQPCTIQVPEFQAPIGCKGEPQVIGTGQHAAAIGGQGHQRSSCSSNNSAVHATFQSFAPLSRWYVGQTATEQPVAAHP